MDDYYNIISAIRTEMLQIIINNEAALEIEVLTMFNPYDDQILFTKIDIQGFPSIYKAFSGIDFALYNVSRNELMNDFVLLHIPVIYSATHSGDIVPLLSVNKLSYSQHIYISKNSNLFQPFNFFFFLIESPFNSILWELNTKRSRIASAMVLSPMISCQVLTGN